MAMNHREEPISVRLRKKIKKETRSGQNMSKTAVAEQPTIRNLRGQNPAKPPRKVLNRAKGDLLEMKTTVHKKKVEMAHPMHQSKRTSPGKIPPKTSTPRSPHIEGERWMKTVEKQTLYRASRLRARLNKGKK